MSREEVCVPEDRKLSAVKSWFTRSVSFGGLNGSTTALSVAAASKGLSEGNGRNGVPDQEAWGGLNVNLKQLSMRRTKASNESERETVPGSPSMVPRNVTPLTPLTPLRWKSNLRDDEEPEETKVVQEPKAVEQRSRLGLTVTNAEEHLPAQDVSEDEQDAENVDVDADGRDKFVRVPKAGGGEEEEDEGAATESPSGQDMKTSSGDDVMTMTIDFLRARLLSERSASKAAKQQIQELGIKVMELELKLEHEVEEKKKAEKSAEEALLKLLTGNFSRVADCTARATQSIQHANSGSGSGGEEIKEELLQRAESSESDFSRTDSIGSSLGSKDSGDSRRKSSSQLARKGESPKEKDNRAAIENRLRKMWSQISSDMHALAEDGSQGELAQEQLMNWMDKVPAVLQNRACPPKSALEEMQFNSAIELNGGQQKKAIYHQGRSAEGRPHGVAPTSRSAEDAFRNAQHDNGGAHAMWDDRDGVGQPPTDSYYRQRERNEPHEKKHSHGHRRSHSADSSNWPAEEDYRLVDVPHQQRLSGKIYPGRTTHNGMTGHQRDNFLNVKSNSYVPPPLSPDEPTVQAPEPKLFLGYGPEPKLFLGYGPAFDAPSDHASLPPYQQGRVSNSSVTDVLLALRKAKASIQKSGSAPFMDPYSRPVKSEYGVDSQTQYTSPRLPERLNHTRSVELDMGAARIRPSNSSPSLNYNPSAVDLRPAAHGRSNYVDQLNVGHGIEFFF